MPWIMKVAVGVSCGSKYFCFEIQDNLFPRVKIRRFFFLHVNPFMAVIWFFFYNFRTFHSPAKSNSKLLRNNRFPSTFFKAAVTVLFGYRYAMHLQSALVSPKDQPSVGFECSLNIIVNF